MRYKLLMHFVIEARDDREAAEVAKKLDEKLLKSALVRMAIQSEGIQLARGRTPEEADGRPVVYAPTRES